MSQLQNPCVVPTLPRSSLTTRLWLLQRSKKFCKWGKGNSFRGLTANPIGGAHSASQDPFVVRCEPRDGAGGGTSSAPFPPQPSRRRRSLGALAPVLLTPRSLLTDSTLKDVLAWREHRLMCFFRLEMQQACFRWWHSLWPAVLVNHWSSSNQFRQIISTYGSLQSHSWLLNIISYSILQMVKPGDQYNEDTKRDA